MEGEDVVGGFELGDGDEADLVGEVSYGGSLDGLDLGVSVGERGRGCLIGAYRKGEVDAVFPPSWSTYISALRCSLDAGGDARDVLGQLLRPGRVDWHALMRRSFLRHRR